MLNIEGLGETKLTVSRVASYTSQLKNRTNYIRVYLLDAGWHTNLPRFEGARPFHVRVESKLFFP